MIKFDNSASLVCCVVVLILALCMLRFHILQKERFFNEGLFNNKLTKEFVKNNKGNRFNVYYEDGTKKNNIAFFIYEVRDTIFLFVFVSLAHHVSIYGVASR